MDLTKLSDVELVEKWLKELAVYPSSREVVRLIGDEGRSRGQKRWEAALEEVGNQREAVRRKEAGL